jgi:hypothetical protein
MKYRITRYPSGGYECEAFLDGKVPAKYRDIVVDEKPPDIIEAENEMERKMKTRGQKQALLMDVIDGKLTIEQAQARAKQIENASKGEL